MNAADANPSLNRLRRWWLSTPRSGSHLLINPWEYRHLSTFGALRIGGGSVAAGAGIICLSYEVYDWAAFFLAIAGLNIAGGYWEISIARAEAGAAGGEA